MEKQALLAIVLSLLTLIAFRYFQAYRTTRTLKIQRPTPTATATPRFTLAPTGETKATTERIFIDTGLYRATLDNRGALLTGWELKRYRSAAGESFNMIPAKRNGSSPQYPGSLLLEDPALSATANNEFYEVHVDKAPNPAGSLEPPVTVVMRLVRGDLFVEKRYQFEKDNYILDVSLTAEKGGKPLNGRILVGHDIGPEQEHMLNKSDQLRAVSYRGGKIRREDPLKNENEIKKFEGDVRWVGLDMQYFAIVAIPHQPLTWYDAEKIPVTTANGKGKETAGELLRLAIPEYGSARFRMYVGPKERASLKAVNGVDLTGLIDYGMFSFLVTPLLIALKWINHCIGNYGYSIVVLTFFLNILLLPFRLKQMISMKKMAVLQPKIKAIQKKYSQYKKTDPRRLEMNQELMALYKEHNVSPLGGCLPNILQAPFLFAFYALLAYSIELRQAPFVAWIRDLSAKDPFYILPILMGISTYVSQAMVPMGAGVDAQVRIMMFVLPLVMTYMFLNYSSGLNLYFLCSNIFQIGFQKIGERCIRRTAAA